MCFYARILEKSVATNRKKYLRMRKNVASQAAVGRMTTQFGRMEWLRVTGPEDQQYSMSAKPQTHFTSSRQRVQAALFAE